MLRKVKTTKRELILFGLFVLIYIAVSMDKLIDKTYNNFHKLEEEINLNESKLSFLKSILSKSSLINAEYDALFSQRTGINDSDSLMQEISIIARRQKVNIINIKPSLVGENERFKKFAIKIESQDDIATLGRFLYALAEENKSIGIERLQIKAQGREELPRISLWLNAAAFKD